MIHQLLDRKLLTVHVWWNVRHAAREQFACDAEMRVVGLHDAADFVHGWSVKEERIEQVALFAGRGGGLR